MKRFAGSGGWNTGRFHGASNNFGGNGNGMGRGRSMTNPAWVNQNNRGFGSFADGDRGSSSSSSVPYSERNIHDFNSNSRADMTSSMTAEELESPVVNQMSSSTQRDYQREAQTRGYCREPNRVEVERWCSDFLQNGLRSHFISAKKQKAIYLIGDNLA